MSAHWTLILNPAAASGKGARHFPKIADLLRKSAIPFELHTSQAPGHCESLAKQAIAAGSRKILVVGGDGTANEVANGLLTQDLAPSADILLAQIPIGTGNDWGRTMGIPSDYRAAITLLAAGKSRFQDVGRVDYAHHGEPRFRYFLNMAGMGYDAAVGVAANEKKARGKGGKLSYLISLISCLLKYQAPRVTYSSPTFSHSKKVFSLVVGIGKFNGGGMMQAPNAVPDDGLLDLTIIHELSKWKVIWNVPRLFNGSFVKNPEVSQFQGRTFTIQSDGDFLLEVDGEDLGKAPATFSIRPKALQVIGRT